MIKVIQSISRLLTSHSSAFVIAAAIAAWCFPILCTWVRGDVSSLILGFIMLTMGLTLTHADFRILFSRPLDVLVGACAQYSLMPLLAFALSRLFSLDPYLSIGIILVGCCPGGVSSNIMSYLCRGDVAFSVGMTTASTLLAPLMTPLLVWWLADARIEVDALGMFRGILLITILPVAAGFLLNYLWGSKGRFCEIRQAMPGLSVVGLALIVGSVVTQVRPQLETNGAGLLLLMISIVFVHNSLGYLAGYQVGRICGFETPKRRTLSIEVGMQNAGMATVLASTYFAGPEQLAVAPQAVLCVVPCAISCAYHSISGTLLAGLFVRYDHYRDGKTAAR